MRPQPVSFKKWLNKFRPSVEALEVRVPAVTVVQNEGVLTITGSSSANVVDINDSGEDNEGLHVIGDSNDFGTFQGVEIINILLKGGADVLTYDVTAQLRGETRHITANLGGESDSKNNLFAFNTHGNAVQGVDIKLDIIGGGKNDAITITFDDILPKTEGSGGSGGSGGFERSSIEIDGKLFTGTDLTKVQFLGDITSSDVDVFFNLGAGDNNFLIQFGGVGTQNGPQPVSHQDYIGGGSFIDVEVIGSNSATNKDNVKMNLASEFGSNGSGGGSLEYDVFLGNGRHDFATVNIDLDTFGVGNFGEFFSGAGSSVHIGLNGEAGNDVLNVTSRDEFGIRSTGPAYIGPLSSLEIILNGGTGVDTTNVDLIGAESGGASPSQVGAVGGFEVDGLLRVHTFGGADNDSATVNLQIAAGSTGTLDAKVKGDGGNDALILNIIDNSGDSGGFGDSGGLNYETTDEGITYEAGLIDGGLGRDTYGSFGNVININTEEPD